MLWKRATPRSGRSDRPQSFDQLAGVRFKDSRPARPDFGIGVFLSAFSVIVRLLDHLAWSVRGLICSFVALIRLPQRVVRAC
jgi:hypothetical protein